VELSCAARGRGRLVRTVSIYKEGGKKGGKEERDYLQPLRAKLVPSSLFVSRKRRRGEEEEGMRCYRGFNCPSYVGKKGKWERGDDIGIWPASLRSNLNPC